MPTATGGAVF